MEQVYTSPLPLTLRLEKNLVWTGILSVIDVLCFFILATLSAVNLCWISWIGLLGYIGYRKRSRSLLNAQFVYLLSSIPIRIILTSVYYTDKGVVMFGVTSILISLIAIITTYRNTVLMTDQEDIVESPTSYNGDVDHL